jgi:hypothetical protein
MISIAPTEVRPGATAPTLVAPGMQQSPAAERKSETIRISLSDVLPPPVAKPLDRKQVTMPIPELTPTERTAPKPVDRKQVTMPIPELSAKPVDRKQVTMPIPDLAGRPVDRKQVTMPIPELSAKPVDRKQVTMPIPDLAGRPVDRKQVTMPIPDLTAQGKLGKEPGSASSISTVVRDGEKKKTSPVIVDASAGIKPILEAKQATSAITIVPQTIRLKRPSSATMPLPSQLKASTDLISEIPTVGRMPDLTLAKDVTAQVLVEPTEPEQRPPEERRTVSSTGRPQTIHLKRPSAPSLEEPIPTGIDTEVPTIVKSVEAEASVLPEAGPQSITQRKTIKIKRTERNVAPRTVKLAQPGSIVMTAPGAPAEAQAPAAEAETASPLFFTLAAVAALLVACLLYILAAQSFGPELVLPVPASLL